ncbi:hypothetical protein Riv7116_3294 [Rivularia sp. PCC 7116]|uniref:hypothetical protein n=1 Tax=Rivularia sp. PCC 7116 TaxID=373994 RepID=UPI00029ECE35|nr:hypothetical protein [Rivularia sp. PCC 7116]AFY55758.1 hypothetical protein Riv7116_3294 [Rivularia sp. PCC 7116]
MKKLICNSLIASVVAVAGAAGFAGEANAQSVDVDFSGTVTSSCEITKVSDGNLGLSNNNNTSLRSKPSEASDGKAGEISVTCAGSGDMSVTEPVAVSQDAQNFADLSDFGASSQLYLNAQGSGGVLASQDPTFGSKTVTSNGQPVSVYAFIAVGSSTQPVPEGDYTFRTTVTVAPQ